MEKQLDLSAQGPLGPSQERGRMIHPTGEFELLEDDEEDKSDATDLELKDYVDRMEER